MSLKRLGLAAAILCLIIAGPSVPFGSGAPAAASSEWSMNATVIEACSCPMFCQCYFNSKPAGHAPTGAAGAAGHAGHAAHAGGAEHFCRANLAYKVNRGNHGDTSLEGVKFWIASDLGGDFSEGMMDWAVLTYDKSMTPAQRAGVAAIMGHVFPVKWKSFTTAEGVIDKWEYNKDAAVALLDGGKGGEVRLKRFAGMSDDPIVIKNLRYWGVPRHDGFVLMPNEVEAYRVGPKAFEFKGTNGFMITFDITSKDVAKAAASN
jgi:hypothetical protein